MQQFIPFEDEWEALEKLRPEDLIPYRVGLRCTHGLAEPVAGTVQRSPSTPSAMTHSPAN